MVRCRKQVRGRAPPQVGPILIIFSNSFNSFKESRLSKYHLQIFCEIFHAPKRSPLVSALFFWKISLPEKLTFTLVYRSIQMSKCFKHHAPAPLCKTNVIENRHTWTKHVANKVQHINFLLDILLANDHNFLRHLDVGLSEKTNLNNLQTE